MAKTTKARTENNEDNIEKTKITPKKAMQGALDMLLDAYPDLNSKNILKHQMVTKNLEDAIRYCDEEQPYIGTIVEQEDGEMIVDWNFALNVESGTRLYTKQ